MTTEINDNLNDEIIETDEKEVNMILGDRVRVRQDGVIRPGIKIPIMSASDAQKALYAKLNAQGVDYDTIGSEMMKLAGNNKTVLRPVNIDHFVVRDSDFKNPEQAKYIRETCTDSDGKIRKIPIWFPTNDISTAIPHNFTAFNGSHEVRCFSFYDGAILKFKYLPPSFKGLAKPKDWLILDTDNPEEASKACGLKVSFGGRYQFSIPGVKTAGDITLPTGSWYGLGDAVAILRRIQEIYGRFSGTFQGKSFLELIKVQQMVKTPEGKRQMQWVVTINTSVDMMELASHVENKAARGAASLHAINGGLSKSTSLLEPPTASQVRETVVASRSTTGESKKQPVETKQTLTPIEEKSAQSSEISETEKAKNALITLALKNGLTNEELEAYAEFKLRQPLNAESDYSRLQRLYGDLKARLEKDKTGMKNRCNELMKEKAIFQNGPEVEGMWEEFKRLAEHNDILPEHMQAHLIELTGLAPEQMNLETLQNAYREVEKRIKSNLDAFKKETVSNYNSLLQKAA